jgi:hypothetical protein
MTDDTSPSFRNAETAPPPRAGGEPLTEGQRSFAKLLGHLLAQRWQEEQRGKHAPDRCEK